MSIYSGFATRVQETLYNKNLYNLLVLMNMRIHKFLNAEQMDEVKFGRYFCKFYRNLFKAEEQKHLPPKFSYAVRDLATFYGVFEKSEKAAMTSISSNVSFTSNHMSTGGYTREMNLHTDKESTKGDDYISEGGGPITEPIRGGYSNPHIRARDREVIGGRNTGSNIGYGNNAPNRGIINTNAIQTPIKKRRIYKRKNFIRPGVPNTVGQPSPNSINTNTNTNTNMNTNTTRGTTINNNNIIINFSGYGNGGQPGHKKRGSSMSAASGGSALNRDLGHIGRGELKAIHSSAKKGYESDISYRRPTNTQGSHVGANYPPIANSGDRIEMENLKREVSTAKEESKRLVNDFSSDKVIRNASPQSIIRNMRSGPGMRIPNSHLEQIYGFHTQRHKPRLPPQGPGGEVLLRALDKRSVSNNKMKNGFFWNGPERNANTYMPRKAKRGPPLRPGMVRNYQEQLEPIGSISSTINNSLNNDENPNPLSPNKKYTSKSSSSTYKGVKMNNKISRKHKHHQLHDIDEEANTTARFHNSADKFQRRPLASVPFNYQMQGLMHNSVGEELAHNLPMREGSVGNAEDIANLTEGDDVQSDVRAIKLKELLSETDPNIGKGNI